MVDPAFEKVLRDALVALEEQLKGACEKAGREAAKESLRAAIAFINAVPRLESMNLALPFVLLMSALEDLDQGRVVPMLAPTEGFDNRKPDSGTRKVQRAFAIFAIDELVRLGMKVDAACRFVAGIIDKAGMNMAARGRVKTPKWKTIQGWRGDATRRGSNDQQARLLAALREECRFSEDMDLTKVQTRLESVLPWVLSSFGKDSE